MRSLVSALLSIIALAGCTTSSFSPSPRRGPSLLSECVRFTEQAAAHPSRRSQALTVCRQATGIPDASERAVAYSSIAYLLLAGDRVEDAVAAAREAVREDASSSNAHFILAATLQQLGRYADAVTAHEEAIRLSPTSAGYRIAYAAMLAKLGRWEDALREGQEAQRLGSDDPWVKAAIETTMKEVEAGARGRQ